MQREWIVIIVLGICLIGLILYLFGLSAQLKSMNRQLIKRRKEKSGQLISIDLLNKSAAGLAGNINRTLQDEEALRIAVYRDEKRLRELIAGISHDLRTPLTAVKGYLQLLQKSGLSKEQEKYLEVALRQTQEQSRLLDRFFEYSWLEGRDTAVRPERINLTNFVTEALTEFIPGFEERGLRVEFEQNTPVFICADPEMSKRIIGNLLRNCIAHSAGDVQARIEETKGFAVLELSNRVEDAGRLNPDTMFERYSAAESGRGSVSGLGLSIVKLLAVQMGGSVHAKLTGDILTLSVSFQMDGPEDSC